MFLLLAASAGAVELFYPRQVGVGQAFEVRVEGGVGFSAMRVRWKGLEVDVPVVEVGGNRSGVALVGTDVLKERPGRERLVVEVRVSGEWKRYGREVEVVRREYPEQRLTLPAGMVTPPAVAEGRIAEDRRVMEGVLSGLSGERFWELPLVKPLDGGVGSGYGLRRVLNGVPKNPHRGVDFRGAAGTPVRAVAAGRVVLVRDCYYSGLSVVVDHGLGVFSLYFHLSEAGVAGGEMVGRGQVLGRVGSTGRSTGPHLHFSLSVPGGLADPLPLMGE